MAEDRGLAALVAPTGAPAVANGGQPSAKRACLRHYDQIPHQVFNTMGASGVERVPLAKLWATMKGGNNVAMHLSNLCFEDVERQNIGMSQVMEVLDKALDRFKQPEARAVINQTLYTDALKELEALQPSVNILNCGPRSGRKSSDVASAVTHYVGATSDHNPEDVIAAAKKVFALLNEPNSKLRALLLFLSGGGLWYSSSVFEKSMRAWCSGKGLTEEEFIKVARARTFVPPSDDARDSMAVLTQS